MIIAQKLGTFNWIVFLIPGCRKQPFRVNDKGNVLLLYLLDRHTQLQITAVARWLFRRENTFDFAGERGRRVDVVDLSTFLEYTYFSRLVKVIIRILQPFFMFFFHYDLFIYFFNLLNFYPVTRFLVTPLLRYSVTRYSVALFSNTRRFIRWIALTNVWTYNRGQNFFFFLRILRMVK